MIFVCHKSGGNMWLVEISNLVIIFCNVQIIEVCNQIGHDH